MAGDATGHRLLILDDEKELCETLAQYFGSVGYVVETAGDVSQALEKLSSGFAVVLTDIKMPGSSGIDFLQEARRRNPKVGIFLMTGYPTIDTVIDAKQYGAVAYFRKPLKLSEVDSRLRAFLGDDVRSAIEGQVLLVGRDLVERMAGRLQRLQTTVCEAQESAFMQAVGAQRPTVVLADAAAPETPDLLRAYQRLGREANSFIVVADEQTLDAANEMLFSQGAAGCVAMESPAEQLERIIKRAVERREVQKLDEQGRLEEMANRCAFAKEYRNGYFCQHQESCPHGRYQGGWIAIEGKEYRKCVKRPLLVDSLDRVGFVSWTGRVETTRSPELRKQLFALVREGKRHIIIDAHGLASAHYNLFEILSDVAAEMAKACPDGVIDVINLTDSLLEEFRKGLGNAGVRCHGVRVVEEKSAFARWGTRFD